MRVVAACLVAPLVPAVVFGAGFGHFRANVAYAYLATLPFLLLLFFVCEELHLRRLRQYALGGFICCVAVIVLAGTANRLPLLSDLQMGATMGLIIGVPESAVFWVIAIWRSPARVRDWAYVPMRRRCARFLGAWMCTGAVVLGLCLVLISGSGLLRGLADVPAMALGVTTAFACLLMGPATFWSSNIGARVVIGWTLLSAIALAAALHPSISERGRTFMTVVFSLFWFLPAVLTLIS